MAAPDGIINACRESALRQLDEFQIATDRVVKTLNAIAGETGEDFMHHITVLDNGSDQVSDVREDLSSMWDLADYRPFRKD